MVLGTLAQGAIIASAEEGILRILLNRPDKKNAVNAQMYDAMAEYLMKGVIKQILGGGY